MRTMTMSEAFPDVWLPQETLDVVRDYVVSIKGPLTTPVGGGIRSLNVALRQLLDLYVCLRPVRWFKGVPSPVKRPDQVDMVIFRENTEDIYAGLEVEEGTPEAARLIGLLRDEFGWDIRPDSGVGIKPVSVTGSKRLIRAAIRYAVEHGRKSVTLVHKGNIQKFTEGAFAKWGYDLVREEFSDVAVGWDDCGGKPGDKVLVIGESLESCSFLDDIRTRIGASGELRAIDITDEARDKYFEGFRGRGGQLATWQWNYTKDIPDGYFDCAAVLQAVQHTDDWTEFGRDLLRVMTSGRNVVLAEITFSPEFMSLPKLDLHLEYLIEKVFSRIGFKVEDFPYYSPEDLMRAFDGMVRNPGTFLWKGVEVFWGAKP